MKMEFTNKQKLFLGLLLGIIILLFTTYYPYPYHADHYYLGQYTYPLIKNGYAPWVLTPISLFGYYPISTPSGFEFLFAVMNALTNLDLPILFYFFSVFTALFAVSGLYLVMRQFSSIETSFLAALVLATMVYFVKNVSNTASSRMLNIMLYPLFILALFKIMGIYKVKNRISLKYIFLSVLLFLTMNLIHRLGQLLIIFILAFILAVVFAHFNKAIQWIKNRRLYNLRRNFYENSNLYAYMDIELMALIALSFFLIKLKVIWIISSIIMLVHYVWFNLFKAKRKYRSENLLFFDMVSFLFYAFIAKAADLAVRGRLLINLLRIIEKYYFQMILGGAAIIVFGIFIIYLILKKFKNLKQFSKFSRGKLIGAIKKNPQKTVSYGLLLVMLFLFSRNFTGDNFYRFGFEHYTNSFMFKGTSPWVIMINFIFNLNNNITILIYFAGIGAIYIFLKDNKSFYDYFFVFVILGFSQFLLDWEYVRLYILPIYAILITIGITFIVHKLLPRVNKKTLYFTMIVIFSMHFIFSNVFIQREYILPRLKLEEQTSQIPEKHFIAAGAYLADNGEISIHTSSSIEYDSKVAYYSKKTNPVIAQNIFVEGKNYVIDRIPLSEIIGDFKKGEKITNLYELRDQIYGGYYYIGRHIYNLNKRSINEKDVPKIISLYNIKYIIDSPNSPDKTEFFESVEPIKNKIYSSGELYLYDLSRGRY